MTYDPKDHRREERAIDFRTVEMRFGRFVISGATINQSGGGVLVYCRGRVVVPDRDLTIRFRDGTVRSAVLRWRDGGDMGLEYIEP